MSDRTVISYRNLAGALVSVHDVPAPQPSQFPTWHFAARCDGCLKDFGDTANAHPIADARKWAAQHADQCKALPLAEDGSDFYALALEHVASAQAAMDRDPKYDDGGPDAIRLHLDLANVYARLAGGAGAGQ